LPILFSALSPQLIHAEIALVENLLRQDLTAVEEAEGLQALMVEQKYTQEQLGGIIGKAQNTLSEILSLNKLPQEIRDECRGDRTIAKNTLIEIAKSKQRRGMLTLYKNTRIRSYQRNR
jgi:ParB family chromosome partitioning protein